MVATEDNYDMKIIILGASGQIGSLLFKDLGSKCTVTGTSRKGSKSLLEFDPFLDDWSALGEADVIINSIGQIEPSQSCSFRKIHLGLTEKIIKNRRLLGDPRIIQVSALGASASHPVEFLSTKGQADDYLLSFPDTVVVRPSIICTPNTMLVRKMLLLAKIAQPTGGLIAVPRGFLDSKIQPVMPGDVAESIHILCKIPVLPGIVNVTGPEVLTFRDIITEMFKARGKSYRILEVPKRFTDLLVKHVLNPFFPSVINEQQYKLLFTDNVANPAHDGLPFVRPTSTKEFWSQAFSRYGSH